MVENDNPNLYRSPDGFSVEVLGRTGLRYREGDQSYFVDAEVLAPPGGIAVYRGSVLHEKPSATSVPVPDQVRERILGNVLAILASHGVPVDLLWNSMSRALPSVPTERLLETPGDLERLVRELLPLLADGILVKANDDGPATAGVELEALLDASTWPDLVDAKFVDQSGQGYHLFVDVFHGSSGRWSRIAAR